MKGPLHPLLISTTLLSRGCMYESVLLFLDLLLLFHHLYLNPPPLLQILILHSLHNFRNTLWRSALSLRRYQLVRKRSNKDIRMTWRMCALSSETFRLVLMRASVGMHGLLLFWAATLSLFPLWVLRLICGFLLQLHPMHRLLLKIQISWLRKKIELLLWCWQKKGEWLELSRGVIEKHLEGGVNRCEC